MLKPMLKPILFVDVDGVLNTPLSWGKHPRENAMDYEKVELLSNLVEELDAYVVISSAWRLHYSLADLMTMLNKRGFANTKRIISTTPDVGEISRRGVEVKNWLLEQFQSSDKFPPYVAIDDQWAPSFLNHVGKDHFVQTRSSKGFTTDDAEQVRKLIKAQSTPAET